jgi:hypothetical protein
MKLIEIMEEKELFGSWQTGPDGKYLPNIFTDKAHPHTYVQNFYEKEFEKYKDKDISLLEIGVMSGGCFLLWKEYFSNPKKLLGVDVTDRFLHPECREIEGVDWKFGNGYDKEFSDTLDTFDIIIDDGPHTLESQIKCIELYLSKLNKGGVFVIEDVAQSQYFDKLITTAQNIAEDDDSDVEYEVECLDFRGPTTPPDDMMFIVRKV